MNGAALSWILVAMSLLTYFLETFRELDYIEL